MLAVEIIFWLSVVLIFHAMIGYPLSLKIINKFVKKQERPVDHSLRPKVSVIVPAHNEEKVIENKLDNLVKLDYPKDLIEIVISSDNSTDGTNQLVKDYITNHPEEPIRLYEVEKRQGKTNAQNEAVRQAAGEILVFTDANAMLDEQSVKHLVSSFVSEDIIYVAGKLVYVKSLSSTASAAENSYWNYDLFMRKVESDVQTITAGNGALYAIRKNEYVDFDPIKCHDSAMPGHAALNHKKAIFNENAVAFEKAGATSEDEFKRKVRMFRGGIKSLYRDPKKYNPFQYGWYSYFYFGHRACRRALFLFHITALITSFILLFQSSVYAVLFAGQAVFYLLALGKQQFGWKHKIFYYPYYYSMTILAQLVGTYRQMTGKSKPFWEKAETTR